MAEPLSVPRNANFTAEAKPSKTKNDGFSSAPDGIVDDTLSACWFREPRPPADYSSSRYLTLTPSGLESIASHKYQSSSSTRLDALLNPIWNRLTEALPLWLAPNMVTTLGGLHCAVAYAMLWRYAPDFDASPPNWVVLLSAWCTMAYYTLDCMDGKQARRTGTSSPLGQLFDHGIDCVCTLSHLAGLCSYLTCGGTSWYIRMQTSLQLAFFMAQWEEYHTHVLPHCTGQVGVTEVNYGMAVLSLANAFHDRVAFYKRPIELLLGNDISDALNLPLPLRDMELQNFLILGWLVFGAVLMPLCLIRVLTHERLVPLSLSSAERSKRRINALSKLLTPAALCVAALSIPPSYARTRYVSVSMGLAFSLITKKMIVFSMAKMLYAAVQFEAIPFVAAAMWIRCDNRLTREGADFVLGVMCFWYLWRVLRWVKVTINQICQRLDINCFTIKQKVKND